MVGLVLAYMVLVACRLMMMMILFLTIMMMRCGNIVSIMFVSVFCNVCLETIHKMIMFGKLLYQWIE